MCPSTSEHFPKSIYFILSNTFLERFSSGGIYAILVLYLNQQLLFNQNASTAIYHINDFILHLATIGGAVIADRWLGLYKTLIVMTLVFGFGSITLMFASMDFPLMLMRILSFIALLAISVGAGCSRCNLNVFGANQFNLPDQSKLFNSFYTIQLCVLKFGQVIGMITIPFVRESVGCFGRNNCYSLVFGITGIMMVFACFVLWKGRKSYVDSRSGSELVKFCKCIVHAIIRKYQDRCLYPKQHWLDHSELKFGRSFVRESKTILSILVMFLPHPIFWALVQQQSSRWVFQASKMDGDLGFYQIKPDQLTVMVPIFIVILIPTFDKFLYPLLERLGIESPLQKMTCGMFCACSSFLISAFLETQIETREVSMFWLTPQYILIAAAEILVWVSSLTFAYTQAPSSMRSIMNSCVYLTVAGGNVIVFIISGAQIFDNQFYEFLFFACLMFVDCVIFIALAVKYQYIGDGDDNKIEV